MHIFNYMYQHVGDRIQIHTNGCDLCVHDARKFANVLAEEKELKDKKIIIYNTCTVFAERQVENELLIKILREAFPAPEYVFYAIGCDVSNNPYNYSHIDNTYRVDDVNAIITYDTAANKDVVETNEPLIYVKIQDGCSHKCSFCIINTFRNSNLSVPYNDLVTTIKEQTKGKEHPRVELAGTEPTEYYDKTTGYLLTDMLEHLIEDVPEVDRFTFTSLDPASIETEYLIEFIGKHKDKFVSHLTIATQSGSDKTLRRMNRRHNVTRIRTLHELAEENGVTLGWDIIVGFPGETEEDFEATCDLVRELRPMTQTIFAYSPREGTPAYNFPDQIPDNIKQQRLNKIKCLVKEYCIKDTKGFDGFAEYTEELTKYSQLKFIKEKVFKLITSGEDNTILLDILVIKDVAKVIREHKDNDIIKIVHRDLISLEEEIVINFFKEFMPEVPVIVEFSSNYDGDLEEFERVYHCIATRRVYG